MGLQTSITARLDRQERFLTQILWNQARESSGSAKSEPVREETQLPLPYEAEGSILTNGIQGSIQVSTQTTPSNNSCYDCLCRCHTQWSFLLSSWNNVLGSLALRSRGNPFSPQVCNMDSCRRRSLAMLSGSYYFPTWMVARAILVTLLNGPSPSISLTVARIVSSDSDLFRFIQTGDCDRVHELLLDRKASPADMVELSYGTINALLFALNSNQYEVCKLLMSWGADAHVQNNTTLTGSAADMAWNMSHECPSPELNHRPLEDIFPAPRDLEHRGFNMLHNVVIGLKHCDLCSLLQTMSKDEIDSVDCHGRSAVHWAAWKGSAATLGQILCAGGDPNLGDAGSRTPMHYACMTHSATCTRTLAEHGADPHKADTYRETPLHCACASARLANVEYLLSIGVNADLANATGATPLMFAVLVKNLRVVAALLAYDVNVEARDGAGETALTLAVWMDCPKIVRVLARHGARLDVLVDSGRTVLHTTAQYGGLNMVETLLKLPLGGIRSTSPNGEGLTATEKLNQRPNVTPNFAKAFMALLIKADSVEQGGWEAGLRIEEEVNSSSDSENDVFLLAMEHSDI